MKLIVKIEGLEETKARFQRAEGEVRSTLSKVIEGLAADLQRHIIMDKLSGQVLHRRTGDLSRSVNYKMTDDLTAVVGANTPYAAYHEYGFTGTQDVRAHLRRSRVQMAAARYNKLGYETRPSKAKARSTGDIMVRAHSREVNYHARSYMRTGLEDMRGEIVAKIQAAVRV